jgi:hypothetical protein
MHDSNQSRCDHTLIGASGDKQYCIAHHQRLFRVQRESVILPLRHLEGRKPRSTHCRMRPRLKTQNRHTSLHPALIPSALLILCRSAPTPGVLPHREPPTPTNPVTLSSIPGEIHGAGARSTRLWLDPWRWCGGVAGEWAPLPHPGVAPCITLETTLPLYPTARIDRPNLPLSYVAYVCFKCFRRFR